MVADIGPGDVIVAKISHAGKFVRAVSNEFERSQALYIICLYEKGYLVLVPNDLYISASFVLNDRDCRSLALPPKFVGTEVAHVFDKHVVSVQQRRSGMTCMSCKNHYDFAEANRLNKDGNQAYVCWSCRVYPPYR